MVADDVAVVRDEIEAYDDGTVARVRILRVPPSDRFERGVKYTFYYGEAGAENPVVRFDNHHGVHELHLDGATYEVDYSGLRPLFQAWRAALPFEKRGDWQPGDRES